MSRKMYEIADEIERVILNNVDPDTGEMSDEIARQLDALDMERDDKALAVMAYIKGEKLEGDQLVARAEVFAKEAKKYADRAKSHANRAESLRQYLERFLPEGHRLQNEIGSISWGKTPPRVELRPGVLATDLPKGWTKTTTVADKTAIKEAMKAAGETENEVATLEWDYKLRIR